MLKAGGGGEKERRRKREDVRERKTDTRNFAALKFKFSCVRVRVLTALSGKARYVRCLIRHALHLLILLGHTGLHFAERGGRVREVVLSAHISCSTFYPLLSSVAEEFWPGFTACHLFLAPLLLPPSHHHLSPPFLRDFYPPDGKGFLRSRSLGIKTFSPSSLFFGSCC